MQYVLAGLTHTRIFTMDNYTFVFNGMCKIACCEGMFTPVRGLTDYYHFKSFNGFVICCIVYNKHLILRIS